MKIRFVSLSSGSSGNSYYLGTEKCGILIDAGISTKSIRMNLKRVGISLDSIYAVFVTHDHADHIKSLGTIAEKAHLPIYATQLTHEGIARNYCMQTKIPPLYIKYIEKEKPIQFHDFLITPFEVPHDGTDNVGYCIEVGGKTFCFVTDLGSITDLAASYIQQADYLVLEANYDEDLLRIGKYPQFLKDRITGPMGHLCNRETAEFLAEHFDGKLKYVWLCHLSEENNHPELAFKTVEMAMRSRGIIVGKDVQVVALKRTTPSDLYEFE